MVVQGNKTPLSTQVAQVLQQRVRTGLYSTGTPLPTVRTLSKEFNVSQGIIQQAIRKLETVGVVKAHHGKGVLVQNEEPCERAAIFFGFIHPYERSMNFHLSVLDYADKTFSDRSNYAIVRSSKNDPAQEREITEHMIANGVKGIILWPATDNTNGDYFMQLSRQIPVVLVDRAMLGATLPTVVLDYYACGREIGENVFGKLNKKRLLVLIDDLPISPYRILLEGIESVAAELERKMDYTIVQIPISRIIQQIEQWNFSEVLGTMEKIRRLVADGQYDALFCTQDEFIEHVMVQTGMMDDFPSLQLATLCGSGPNQRTIRYNKFQCLKWASNHGKMISLAADLVQQWVLSRQLPEQCFKVKFELMTNKMGR